MAKVVITKDRDVVDQPTKFLAADGTWKSVSNKQEFKAIAKEVKMEHNIDVIAKLMFSSGAYAEPNVKINPEFTPDEWTQFVGLDD